MKHHHTFLMLILLGVAHQAEAQFDPKDQHIDLYLSAGASYWQPEWKDMAQFAGGYNQYFASTLTQPLGTPQAKFSPYLEGGLGLGNSIDIAIGYSLPTEYNMAAEFANKERREFRLVTQQSEVRFAMNIFHIKKVFFGLHFAALFVKGKLYSGYRYRNDFLSYGVEKRMNGIFSTNDTQLSGGAQIYWLLGKRFALTAQWENVGVMRDLLLGKTDVLGIKDMLDGYSTTYSNHAYTSYYPRDYENMNNPYAYSVGSGDLLRPTLSGNRFTLSLRYNFEILSAENAAK